jgi:hypothetical protein
VTSKKKERQVSAQHVANIVATCLDASGEEHAAGMLWYQSFASAIAAYGQRREMPRETCLAAFAALSPQCLISRNWRLYRHAIDGGKLEGENGVLGHIRRKVDGLLKGNVTIEQATKGLKVGAFYANLAGDLSQVTIDRHAIAAATRQEGPAKSPSCTQYRELEAAYQVAASQLGIQPAQCQAITWIVWRRQKGTHDGGGMALLP